MYAPKGTTLRGIVAVRTFSSVCIFLNTFWELLDSTLCVLQITGSIKSVILLMILAGVEANSRWGITAQLCLVGPSFVKNHCQSATSLSGSGFMQ